MRMFRHSMMKLLAVLALIERNWVGGGASERAAEPDNPGTSYSGDHWTSQAESAALRPRIASLGAMSNGVRLPVDI